MKKRNIWIHVTLRGETGNGTRKYEGNPSAAGLASSNRFARVVKTKSSVMADGNSKWLPPVDAFNSSSVRN